MQEKSEVDKLLGGIRVCCKVSVVIPVYNVERYLGECLESVFVQTLSDIEILCIDDNSTDESLSILKQYQKSDNRIQIIELAQNKGLSYVRNVGMENSKGKYIYFLDSDDMIEKNALEILFRRAERDRLDVIFFDAKIKYEDKEFIKKFETYVDVHRGKYEGIKSGMELFEEFVSNQEWTSSVPRQFWSRQFLMTNDIRFYEGIIHEDELFTLVALTLAERAEFINECLFIRRFRKGSIMTNVTSDRDFYGYFITYYLANKYICKNKLKRRAIDKHLAILYGKIVRAYEKLKEQYDLSEGFCDQEIKNAFYFFESTQNKHMAYGCFGSEAIEEIKKYRIVYVYGAGIIAGSVCESLERNDIIVQSFIVSQLDRNPKIFKGRNVRAIDELDKEDKNILVIIAVNMIYQEEVKALLENKKVKYVTYNSLEVL